MVIILKDGDSQLEISQDELDNLNFVELSIVHRGSQTDIAVQLNELFYAIEALREARSDNESRR